MKIQDLRAIRTSDRVRVAATIIWEDVPRPNQEVYFDCPASFATDISPNPNAFLLACVMPALDYGEGRVLIEGSLCPELRNGLHTAFRVIRDWYPQYKIPRIESTSGYYPSLPRTPPRVASFMSAGIDALATLRCNRRDFPLDHPAAIRDCFFFLGFNRHDFDAHGPVAERLQDFERRLDRMSALAREAQINLIPVHSNIRFIARDSQAWNERGMGAGMASIGHLFSRRLSRVLIGSEGSAGIPSPWGTHPLLDPNFSSSDLEVRHDCLYLSRLQKTALVSDWPAAMGVMQCCWQNDGIPESINCGHCGKCLRTMVQLAALGKLDGAPTLPNVSITPEMIDAVGFVLESDLSFLEDCIEPFVKSGRRDLVEAIRRRIKRERDWIQGRGWRSRVRRWDKRLTQGLLSRSVQRLQRLRRRRERPGIAGQAG
jgi:hypothetical protein